MNIRPYDPTDPEDVAALWNHKHAFERELGEGTGDEEKAAAYHSKLTDSYRSAWIEWVDRCVDSNERCVLVVDGDDRSTADDDDRSTDDGDDRSTDDGDDRPHNDASDHDIGGYVFILPETHRFIWDAAVLNEIFVAPAFRGTGVADELLTAAIAVAAEQDLPIDRLILDVDPENDRARRLYDRFGFEEWGELIARPI